MTKGMKVSLLAGTLLILTVVVYYAIFAGDDTPPTQPSSDDSQANATGGVNDEDNRTGIPVDYSLSTDPDKSSDTPDWMSKQPAVVGQYTPSDTSGTAGGTSGDSSLTGSTDSTDSTTGPSWLSGDTSTTTTTTITGTDTTTSGTDSTIGTASAWADDLPSTGTNDSTTATTGTTTSTTESSTGRPSWMTGTDSGDSSSSTTTTSSGGHDLFDPYGPGSRRPFRVADSTDTTSGTGTSGRRTYTIQSGDTLAEVAARQYGKSSLWRQIVDANPGLDPSALRIGHVITLPQLPEELTGQPPVPPGTTTDTVNGKIYIVKQGDTPTGIAQKMYGSAGQVSLILDANPGLNPSAMKIGQQLVIPDQPDPTTATTTTGPNLLTTDPLRPDRMIHTVRSGDTLGNIAKQHYGKASLWRRISEANPGVDPSALKIGQKLTIPDPSSFTTDTTTTTDTGTSDVVDDPLDIGIDPAAHKYTVVEGDSLWSIAVKEYGDGTLSEIIYQANTTRMKNKHDLRIGQTLVIPPKPLPSTPPSP